MSAPPIPLWHESERPREKLLRLGAAALSEAELLAILLQTGIRGRRRWTWRGGCSASSGPCAACSRPTAQAVVPDPGPRAGQVRPAAGLARTRPPPLRRADAGRARLCRTRGPPGSSCGPGCATGTTRCFAACFSTIATGSSLLRSFSAELSTAPASIPRDVVKLALARNAAAVILAHNHPSGIAEPSQADELITGRLRDALALVDIRVLDHIVVGDGVDRLVRGAGTCSEALPAQPRTGIKRGSVFRVRHLGRPGLSQDQQSCRESVRSPARSR